MTVTAGRTANVLLGSKRELGKLCITTFDDSNNNRSRDAGEVGLSGFVFQVRGQSSAITLRADLDGICSDLPVGSYTVVEQTADGWVPTTPTTKAVTIRAGQTERVSFGAKRETGKLCVTAFEDLDSDGVRDVGERGLSGFVFQVSGTGAAATLTTKANVGACSDFPVGAYTVNEQPQDGWTATTTPTLTVTIRANQTEKLSFGSRQQAGRLCIKKFDDRNANRAQDKDEPGLQNFVFQIKGTDLDKTLTTDSKGDACWPLPVGEYTVDEQQQGGWIATTLTTQKVTILSGRTAKPLLFGSRREASKLCITTFYDKNRNRKQDKDEPGLAGIVFQVSGTGDVKTATTDVAGTVCLPLAAGRYTVAETPTPGWTPTSPTKLNIVIKESQTFGISFGNTKSEPECSELDKTRERQLILNQYERNWRNSIERERERVIAAAAPQAHGKVTATLDQFEPQVVLKTCTTAFITLRYVWKVEVLGGTEKPRTERVKGHQNVACEKAGPNWICQ